MNVADARLFSGILFGLSLVVLAVAGVMDDGKTPALVPKRAEKLADVPLKIERRTPWRSLNQKALVREKRSDMVVNRRNAIRVEETMPGLETDTDDPEGVVHTLDELKAMKPGAGVQWRDQMPIARNGKSGELRRRKKREGVLARNDRINQRKADGGGGKVPGEGYAKKALIKKYALKGALENPNLDKEISAVDKSSAALLTNRRGRVAPRLGEDSIKVGKLKQKLNVVEGKGIVESLIQPSIHRVLRSSSEALRGDGKQSAQRTRRYIRKDDDDDDDDDDKDDDDDDDDDDKRDRRKRRAKARVDTLTPDPVSSRIFRVRRQEDGTPKTSTQAGLRQLMRDVESIAVDDDLAFDAMSSPNLDTSPDNVPELFDRNKLGIKRKKRQSPSGDAGGVDSAKVQSGKMRQANSKYVQTGPSERIPGGLGDTHIPGEEAVRSKRSRKKDDDDDDDDDEDDDDDDKRDDGDRRRKKREAAATLLNSFNALVNKTKSATVSSLSSPENVTQNIKKQLLEAMRNIEIPEGLRKELDKTLASLPELKLKDAGELLRNPTQWLRLKRDSDDDQDDDYYDGDNDVDGGDYSDNDGDDRAEDDDRDDGASSADDYSEQEGDGTSNRGYEKTVVKVSKVKSSPPLITAPPKDIRSELVKLQEEEEKDVATMAPTLSPRKKVLDSSLRELTAKLDKIEDDLKRKEAIQRAKLSKRSYSSIQDGNPADNYNFGLSDATVDKENLASFGESSGPGPIEKGSANTEGRFQRDVWKSIPRVEGRSLSPGNSEPIIKVGKIPEWMLKMNEIVNQIHGDIADVGSGQMDDGIGKHAERRMGQDKSTFPENLAKDDERVRAKRANAGPLNKIQKKNLAKPRGQAISEMSRKVDPSDRQLLNSLQNTKASTRNGSRNEVQKKQNAVADRSKVSNPVKNTSLPKSSVASLFRSRLKKLLALKHRVKNNNFHKPLLSLKRKVKINVQKSETREMTIKPIIYNKQINTYKVVASSIQTKKHDLMDGYDLDKTLGVYSLTHPVNTYQPKTLKSLLFSQINEKSGNDGGARMDHRDSNFIRHQDGVSLFKGGKNLIAQSTNDNKFLDSTEEPVYDADVFEAFIVLNRVKPVKTRKLPFSRPRIHRPPERVGPSGSREANARDGKLLKVVKLLTRGRPGGVKSNGFKRKNAHRGGNSQGGVRSSWKRKLVRRPNFKVYMKADNEVYPGGLSKDKKRIASLLMENILRETWKPFIDKHGRKYIRIESAPNLDGDIRLENITTYYAQGKTVFPNYSNRKLRLKLRKVVHKKKSDKPSKKEGRKKLRSQKAQKKQVDAFESHYGDSKLDIPHLSYKTYENFISDILKFPLVGETYRRLRRDAEVNLPVEKQPETPTERALKKEIMQLLWVFPVNVAEKKSDEKLELQDEKDIQSSDLAATIIRIDEEDNEPFLDTDKAGDLFAQKQRLRRRSLKDASRALNAVHPEKKHRRNASGIKPAYDHSPGHLSRSRKYVSPYKKIHPENDMNVRNRLMDNSLADRDTSSSFDSQETYFRAMPYLIAQDNAIAQSAARFSIENSQNGVFLRDGRTLVSKTLVLPDVGMVNLTSALLSSETDIRQLKSDNEDVQRNDEEIEEMDVKHYDELLRGADDDDDDGENDDGDEESDNEDSGGDNTEETSDVDEINGASRKRRSARKKSNERLNDDDNINENDDRKKSNERLNDDDNIDENDDTNNDDDDKRDKGGKNVDESSEIMNYENLMKVKQTAGDMAAEKSAGVDTPVFDGNYPSFENNSQQVSEHQPEETDYLEEEVNQEPGDIESDGDWENKEEDEVLFVDTVEDNNIELDDNGKRVEPLDEVAFIEEDPVTPKPVIYAWGDWSECSASCGIGQRFRSNRCLEGQPCLGKAASNEVEVCSDRDC